MDIYEQEDESDQIIRDIRYLFQEQEYLDYESRLESFKTWSLKNPKKEDVAIAGFSYKGYHDLVKCFHCGLQLGNWKDDDNPIREHRKYSPNCEYLLTF